MSKTETEHHCRICRGNRDIKLGVCMGCGTPVKKCRLIPKRQKKVISCPGCGYDGKNRQVASGRYRCSKCTAIYEAADFCYLDTRPEAALDKKERMEKEERLQKRKRDLERSTKWV